MCTTPTPSKYAHTKINITEHDAEHKRWNRRSFIQALGLAGSGSMMLAGSALSASKASPLTAALAASQGERTLILIRLKGGNDGLNTIVPISQYDAYARARPKIRIPETSLVKLSDDHGIPSFMQPLEKMWGEGQMKVVLGAGYDTPNLSHFRSSDIWASGIVEEKERTGVLGRYFEDLLPEYLVNPPEIPPAIQIGSIGNLLFDGEENHYAFTVANPGQLSRIAQTGAAHDVVNVPDCTYGSQLKYMRGLTNTTYKYAEVINKAYVKSTNAVEYGDGRLSKQLSIIARMIKGQLGTKIYMVTLGGFDTHANQIQKHEELMTEVTEAVTNFYADLAAEEMDRDVLSMTFSEFGRRVEENGSEGTDHGSSAPVLLFGGGLGDNGILGTQPDLNDLDRRGNLKTNIDFRSLYSSVLKGWLCVDPAAVDNALGTESAEVEDLDLGLSCFGIGGSAQKGAAINHTAIYEDNTVYLDFALPFDSHVDIQLYNIIGQSIATLVSENLCSGPHRIDIKNLANAQLASGYYVYRIFTNYQKVGKQIRI